MDKRKEVKKEFKRQEQEKLVSILPMSKEQLKEFFDHLDKGLNNEGDVYSLKLTMEFCENKELDFNKVKEWAAELGGYNDEEILWNCEQEYDFLLDKESERDIDD